MSAQTQSGSQTAGSTALRTADRWVGNAASISRSGNCQVVVSHATGGVKRIFVHLFRLRLSCFHLFTSFTCYE